MHKVFKHILGYFQNRSWIFFVAVIVFLVIVHTLVLVWHEKLVDRYHVFSGRIKEEQILIQVPKEFEEVQPYVRSRSFFTRPDILTSETWKLHSGVRAFLVAYHHEIIRLRGQVVSHVEMMKNVVRASEEYIFPERDVIQTLADTLMLQIRSGDYDDFETMNYLVNYSEKMALVANQQFDTVWRKVLSEDVRAIEHEIVFIDSLMNFMGDEEGEKDIVNFGKEYKKAFDETVINNLSTDLLQKRYDAFSSSLGPLREHSARLRAEAKIKRADIVAAEAQKWKNTDTIPPKAVVPDVFDQINVSLTDQMMYAYEDGDLILSTPITSGRRDFETVTGTFQVYIKSRNRLIKSPFPEEEYELWVDYWLGFHEAYGIHDSCNSRDCWRTRFGASTYVYNGSHGCVNTPYKAVADLYKWARVGTTVHVE